MPTLPVSQQFKPGDYYYYYRDEENRPRITVCLLVDDNFEIAKGISLCSLLDNPRKKTGRRIAKQRAQWALENRDSNCEVNREPALSVFQKCGFRSFFDVPQFKATFEPALNTIETRILGIAVT